MKRASVPDGRASRIAVRASYNVHGKLAGSASNSSKMVRGGDVVARWPRVVRLAITRRAVNAAHSAQSETADSDVWRLAAIFFSTSSFSSLLLAAYALRRFSSPLQRFDVLPNLEAHSARLRKFSGRLFVFVCGARLLIVCGLVARRARVGQRAFRTA